MGAPFGLARAQGQKRSGAVQGLDLGLLVYAQDQRPVRRVEIEPHNIPHLLNEEGIRRQLEGLGAVRLQREGTPDATHRVVAQTGTPGHGPGAPVGGVLGGGLQGQRNHPLNVGIVNHTGATAARLVQQAVQPLFQESGPPFPHRVNTYPQLGGHRGVAPAIGTGQNDSGPQGQRLGRFGPAGPLFQGFPFGAVQGQRRHWSASAHIHPPFGR